MTGSARRVALVAGASGIVGHRLAQHLASDGTWQVIGLSRRLPATAEGAVGVEYVACDLRDRAACDELARTEAMLFDTFDRMRAAKLIPPA